MNTVHRIIRNTFSIAMSNIITKVIAFFITIFLARYLEVSDFGKYTFVISYLMMFGFVAFFGLDPVIIRNISRNPESIGKMMSNALIIRIITSIATIFLLILVIRILNYPNETIYYIQLLSVILLFQGLSYLLESLFQAHLKMGFSAISQVTSKFALGILIYCVVEFNLGLKFIFLSYLFSEIIRLIISFRYSKMVATYNFDFDPMICKSLIKQSLPFVLGYGLFTLYNRFDILMLSSMQGDIAVAFYSGAYRLTESILFIPAALASTLMPVMAKHFDTNNMKLKLIYTTGTKYIFMLLFPITVGSIILSNEIIMFVYTEKFVNSIAIFQILALTIIFNSLNSLQTSILISANRQQLNNISVSGCAILNVVLNLILIPKFSYVGAGIATLISVICLYLLGFYFVYNTLGLQPFNLFYIRYIEASVIMGFFIYYLNFNLILNMIIGGVIYLLIVFLLRGFDMNEIQMFKK